MTDAEADKLVERIKGHVAQLMEHCDSVQVFATFKGTDQTRGFFWGGGNFYSRLGVVRHWLLKEDETARVEGRMEGGSDGE